MTDEPRQEAGRVSAEIRTQLPVLTPSAAARLLAQPQLLGQLYRVVAFLNGELRCVFASGELGDRCGSQLLGASFLQAIPRQFHERFRDTCARVSALGTRCTFDYRQDTGLTTLQVLPLQDERGVPLILVVRGATSEPSQWERERDERLRYAVEASGVGTWSWDRTTDAVTWDDGLCRIYGLTPAQSPRAYEDYVHYLHPEDRPEIEAQIGRCLQTGIYEDFEHRLVRPDGTVRHVFCRGAAATNERGEVVGMSGGIFDITDRKRLEEHLHHVQKLEAFGQLAAGIAHNFNNLLSVVLPNAEICRLHAAPALQGPIADIEHAASRASEMVRQLMLFARHEVSEKKVPVDLASLAERTLGICRATFDRRITIKVLADDGLPPVLARAGEIEQVLLNMCINARDALEEAPNDDPRIELRLERGSGSTVRLRVIDNGPGMDEATRSRLFEPFFTTKEIGRGTGLGLASAYGIVLDHQGTISCQSAPGEGAAFSIELPLAHGKAAAAAPLAASLSENRGDQTETILLIDDEPLVRRALSSLLKDAGFRVLEAGDGREGLTALESRTTVDLILLDRSMPNMSGDEFLAELRVRRPQLPVILLTGQPGSELDSHESLTVISKPPRRATLLSMIRQKLDDAACPRPQ
jgi:two-component system, cell cycle sensor histidine kinase and response regulator CckA